jgi:hypothetical protein
MQADGQALPSGSHAERSVQSSRRQEYRAANAGGPRAQQASKLETRALFAGSQGGTVARAGGNPCAPLSVHHGTAALTLCPRSAAHHPQHHRHLTASDGGLWSARSRARGSLLIFRPCPRHRSPNFPWSCSLPCRPATLDTMRGRIEDIAAMLGGGGSVTHAPAGFRRNRTVGIFRTVASVLVRLTREPG